MPPTATQPPSRAAVPRPPRSPFAFDPGLAARLCAHAAAAYDTQPAGEIIDCDPTETRVVARELSDAPGGPFAPPALVLSFRGTARLRNWITDIDCLKTGYPTVDFGGCRVHLGFWRAWLSVRDNVLSLVSSAIAAQSNSSRRPRIYLTGHSLGGALAMLAAHALRLQTGQAPVTYTFGQPRVGNAYFAQMFDLALRPFTFRLIHADDIVPRVPWVMGGYRHAGQEAFYLRNQYPFILNPDPIQKLPFDIRNACRELRHCKNALLADHHINTYLSLFQ